MTNIITHKNGKPYTTPFKFTDEEIDNLRYNSKTTESYRILNIMTRRSRTITGIAS